MLRNSVSRRENEATRVYRLADRDALSDRKIADDNVDDKESCSIRHLEDLVERIEGEAAARRTARPARVIDFRRNRRVIYYVRTVRFATRVHVAFTRRRKNKGESEYCARVLAASRLQPRPAEATYGCGPGGIWYL